MAQPHADELLAMCRELMAVRTETQQSTVAHMVLTGYRNLSEHQRQTFFEGLEAGWDPDPDAVVAAATRWQSEQDAEHLVELLRVTKPPRRDLLRRLHLAPGGTGALVRMRADLLTVDAQTSRLDIDMRVLLREWFTRGFLQLRRIDWDTSALVLERIATNEAVHEVSDWLDLRARVKPSDRRCYGFFHPAMPDEPLIFVMVALTTGLPRTVGEVLETDRTPISAADATSAVFYSISNCQPGLRGVSLGNLLIKRVARTLSADLPHLTRFMTLSPVTGLADTVSAAPADAAERARQAARYLLPDQGRPADPVARFHLGNGAILDAIVPDADPSATGMARSWGVMASYLYDLDAVDANHEAYVTGQVLQRSAEVDVLLD